MLRKSKVMLCVLPSISEKYYGIIYRQVGQLVLISNSLSLKRDLIRASLIIFQSINDIEKEVIY